MENVTSRSEREIENATRHARHTILSPFLKDRQGFFFSARLCVGWLIWPQQHLQHDRSHIPTSAVSFSASQSPQSVFSTTP